MFAPLERYEERVAAVARCQCLSNDVGESQNVPSGILLALRCRCGVRFGRRIDLILLIVESPVLLVLALLEVNSVPFCQRLSRVTRS